MDAYLHHHFELLSLLVLLLMELFQPSLRQY